MRQRMIGLRGTLQVVSALGQGTRVRACLPITAA
jgi:signal transduction histidine kinase